MAAKPFGWAVVDGPCGSGQETIPLASVAWVEFLIQLWQPISRSPISTGASVRIITEDFNQVLIGCLAGLRCADAYHFLGLLGS